MSDLLSMLDRPIAFHRPLVKLTGSVTAALMLSQALYWQKRTDDPDGWFYKTQADWEEETGLTRYEQEGARKKLLSLRDSQGRPLWEEERRDIPAKLYYRINLDVLESILLSDFASKPAKKSANKNAEKPQTGKGKNPKQGRGKTTNREGEKPQSFYIAESTTESTAEREGAQRPTPPPPLPEMETTVSEKRVKYKPTGYTKGPYLKGARIIDGYVAPGTGINPVQVYHERNRVDDRQAQLTDPQQDDLVMAVGDLDRWREAVVAWSQAGYKPRNIKGQLDWYHAGPPRHGAQHSSNGRPMSTIAHNLRAVDEAFEMLEQHGVTFDEDGNMNWEGYYGNPE